MSQGHDFPSDTEFREAETRQVIEFKNRRDWHESCNSPVIKCFSRVTTPPVLLVAPALRLPPESLVTAWPDSPSAPGPEEP